MDNPENREAKAHRFGPLPPCRCDNVIKVLAEMEANPDRYSVEKYESGEFNKEVLKLIKSPETFVEARIIIAASAMFTLEQHSRVSEDT